MVNADHLDRPAKLKVVEIESDQVQKKATLIVLGLLELKNVRTRHALIHYLEKNGNAAAKNR